MTEKIKQGIGEIPMLNYETNNGKLYQGNCLDVMKGIPAGSVDCLITDPPY